MQTGRLKVLVTGASGFFGRHLVPSLQANGHDVFAMSRQNVSFGPAVTFVRLDGYDEQVDWCRHLDGAQAVVHLAGLAHPTSIIPESEYEYANCQVTKHIAKAAERVGARFIYMSSVAAQAGSSADHVLVEDDDPNPLTPYGRSKLHAEQEIISISNNYVIFRPTLTFGQGVGGNMARLVKLATKRIPPPLGGLHNKRSILAVENMCAAVDFALKVAPTSGNIFLLADTEPLSVAEMVGLLREGARSTITNLPIPSSLLSMSLRLFKRSDIIDKISRDLVVSVEKLRAFGFRWAVDTRSALRALGACYGSNR